MNWTNEGCDAGVWVLRSTGGDIWGSVKPSQAARGGYTIHWFGKGRGKAYHWIHGKSVRWGLFYALRDAAFKAGFRVGEFAFPDLGIDWSAVHVLEHSIGHWTGPTRHHPGPYRNNFATDDATEDFARCQNLVTVGAMKERGRFDAGMYWFSVTPVGFATLGLPVPS